MSNRENLHVSGIVKNTGGVYAEVHVSAVLKVDGDLECESLHSSGSTKIRGSFAGDSVRCSGALSIAGNARMDHAHCSGSLRCDGDVSSAERLKVSGSVQIGGSLRARETQISGACHVGGQLHATELTCSGALTADGDVEAETFRTSGAVTVNGLLNAEQVEMKLCSPCRIGEIGGSSITVLSKEPSGIFFRRDVPRLTVKIIEGDTVELEATRAEIVRGKNVRIGKECEIDRVEYSGNLEVEGGSVREKIKV